MSMQIALLPEVFLGPDTAANLTIRLREARASGADLVVLPELPLNPWSPASRDARDEDAEGPGGPREQILANAAADADVAVVGGAIVRDPRDGRRYNTAFVHDRGGDLVAAYRKAHLPEEPGFWETSHYEAGNDPAPVVTDFEMPLGLQVCSDNNRPQGAHALAATGAELIVAPRATEAATYARWQLVFRATAMTACVYLASVNRPSPENGVPLGGPSVLIGPDGEIILETENELAVAPVAREAIEEARGRYPGYLPVRTDLYARAWNAVSGDGSSR